MTSKRRRPQEPRSGKDADPEKPPDPGPDSPGRAIRGFLLDQVLGATFGRFIKLIAAVLLGIAGLLLTIAWNSGPKRALDASKYSKLTARTEGRIVESWLAVELDPREMGRLLRWRAVAKATPCAIVEYHGDWGAPARRAFCGNRFTFSDEYTLHDLREMAPGVPFVWARDDSGFILPEIRMTTAAREWLATHPAEWLLPDDPPAKNALEGLRMQLDRPVDQAVAGWSRSSGNITLAVDPKHPDGALPARFLEVPRPPNWVVSMIVAIPGLLLWSGGMAILFGDLPRLAGIFMMVLPLLFLPWWGEHFPRFLRYLHKDFSGVIADMLGSTDPLGRLVAGKPEDAMLVDEERLVWRAGTGAYADTFGRFRFTRPSPVPNADDAVSALASAVAVQVEALPEPERVALFQRLERDKLGGRRRAGAVFLPAARDAVLDVDGSETVRRAATRFLEAWFTQPMEWPYPRDLGYHGRLKLYADLADFPIYGVALFARHIAGLPEK